MNRFDVQGTGVYFPLPIEPMSETITIRRTTGTTTTLMRGDSYEIDFDTGVIRFFGAAAEILKNRDTELESLTIRYKYLDKDTLESEGEEVTGLGIKIGGTANFDKASINLNWRS